MHPTPPVSVVCLGDFIYSDISLNLTPPPLQTQHYLELGVHNLGWCVGVGGGGCTLSEIVIRGYAEHYITCLEKCAQ